MATQIVEEQQPKVDLAVGSSRIVEAYVIAVAVAAAAAAADVDDDVAAAADEHTADADRDLHPIPLLLWLSHHTARSSPDQKPVFSPRSSQQPPH